MQDKNQNTSIVFPADAQRASSLNDANVYGLQSLGQNVPLDPSSAPPAVLTGQESAKQNLLVRLAKRADVVLAILLIFGSVGLVINSVRPKQAVQTNRIEDRFETTEISLVDFSAEQGMAFGTQKVTINGGLVITPTSQPTSSSAGQLYYDQVSNVLAYYNGTQYVPLNGDSEAAVNIAAVGAGLNISGGGQLSNTGVLSLQGQVGNVSLTAGNGIGITGTTISNTGVTSIVSGNPTLVITNDGAGNHVLTVNLGGAGVTSLNGQAGVLNVANATGAGGVITLDNASTSAKGIAQFDATNFTVVGGAVNTVQNINTTASPTFAGVNTNSITPSGALTVGVTGQQLMLQGNASTQLTATGGGFTTTFGFSGVPTGPVTYNLDRSVTPGTYTLCSTVGNCAGSGTGVTSVVGGAGNRIAKFTASQNIENSTISDDGTNVTTSADLIIQGGDAIIGVASAQTGTLRFAHSGSSFFGSIVQGGLTDNRQYLLPDAGGTFCLTSGGASNCSGAGSSNTLQAAYEAGSTITTSDNRSIVFTFADTGADSNMLINLECDTACAGNGRFAVQDDGADILSVAPSAIVLGNATTNVPITISSGTGAINIGNGAEARTLNIGTGAAAQTVTLGSTNTTSTTLIQGGTGNITLNSGGTIALQDSTTIAGNLTITGTATDTLTVKSPGNGSGAVVLNLQQSDNDSVFRVTDTGTLAIGNATNIAGIFAIGNGAGNDFVEIRVDNITANTTLQLPNVASGSTFCTDAGNCGTATGKLQNAYSYSIGGNTPEIKLDTTRNGIDIQDADGAGIGDSQNFLSLRGPNNSDLGALRFGFGTRGDLFMQPSTDLLTLVDINTSSGGNLFTIDGQNSRVGIALGGSVAPTVSLDVGGNTNLRGTNTGDALTVSNASSTGNIAVFRDGATTVATIADGGLTTFQNTTNSANAFRILNATGTGEHVGVDTTDSILRLLANNTGHLSGTGAGNWITASTTLTEPRGVVGAVTVNGYVYSVGGCDGGGAQDEVYYARANSDGTLGAWAATTSLPFNMCGHAVTTYNGYIYANGATGNAATARDVVYAKPNADGTISGWTTQNDPTNLIGLKDHGMAAYNGYLYITAGQTDDGFNTRNRNVYYGRIMANGSVPSFSVQTNWLSDQDHIPGQTIVANGFLYVMGSANFDKFYYGRINADGTVAANTLATGVTDARKYASIAVMNGYMYVIAGGTTPTNTIQYAPLASSGDIGAFTTDTTTLPAAHWLCPKNAVTLNGYIYLYGCSDTGDAPTNTVYYAGGSRVKVGASLDLVGYSGENMGAGGSGGQLTAGNTFVNGSLSVTGNSNLKDGATVNNALSVLGTASVQTATNTTIGFQVLNASAVPQFIVDTTNSRVYIGNPTVDGTGALLVLDTKNDPGDPTGVNGGMYYNSSIGRFRCYESDMWGECLGVPKPNTGRATYFAADGDSEMNGYGDTLGHAGNNGSGAGSSTPPDVTYQTGSVSGNSAGLEGSTIYGLSGHQTFQTQLSTFTSTSVRVWTGLTTELRTTMAASATPTGQYAAFRFDTSAGDATWKCVTRDGTSSTIVDSGIALSTATTMEIVSEASRVVFKINDAIVCTITTNLPSGTARVITSITTLTADIRTLFTGWLYVESRYDGY